MPWKGTQDEFINRLKQEIISCKNQPALLGDNLPDGITATHILKAINEIDNGIIHEFSESIDYDVLYKNNRYAPKAVIGVAAMLHNGEELGPYDFKGGIDSKCFKLLSQNNFEIVTKGDKELYPNELYENDEYWEGAASEVKVVRYERDKKARKKCISEHGLICKVCDFDFEKQYGAIGEGFIHVHHVKEISEIGENYNIDPLKDLVPVCPNCHAMLHKRKPPFAISELRAILRKIT